MEKKSQKDFLVETEESIKSILSFEDYGCFDNFEMKFDPEYSDGDYEEYSVSFTYETHYLDEDVKIEFKVRQTESESEYITYDFDMETGEDNWMEISSISGYECLWMTVLGEVERRMGYKIKGYKY